MLCLVLETPCTVGNYAIYGIRKYYYLYTVTYSENIDFGCHK